MLLHSRLLSCPYSKVRCRALCIAVPRTAAIPSLPPLPHGLTCDLWLPAEFNPDLVIVSAGFDAAQGDPLGGMLVSPVMYVLALPVPPTAQPPIRYGWMTQQLATEFHGKLVLALEGGYSIPALQLSITCCLQALIHAASTLTPEHTTRLAAVPAAPATCASFRADLTAVAKVQRELWPCIQLPEWPAAEDEEGPVVDFEADVKLFDQAFPSTEAWRPIGAGRVTAAMGNATDGNTDSGSVEITIRDSTHRRWIQGPLLVSSATPAEISAAVARTAARPRRPGTSACVLMLEAENDFDMSDKTLLVQVCPIDPSLQVQSGTQHCTYYGKTSPLPTPPLPILILCSTCGFFIHSGPVRSHFCWCLGPRARQHHFNPGRTSPPRHAATWSKGECRLRYRTHLLHIQPRLMLAVHACAASPHHRRPAHCKAWPRASQ